MRATPLEPPKGQSLQQSLPDDDSTYRNYLLLIEAMIRRAYADINNRHGSSGLTKEEKYDAIHFLDWCEDELGPLLLALANPESKVRRHHSARKIA